MMIKLISKEENKMVFELSNINSSFANALRRIMISEIPTLAIDSIEIIENNATLDNDILSHRLGLIPIRYNGNLEDMKMKNECNCYNGECEKCLIQIQLKISSSNKTEVYSTDLELNDKVRIIHYSSDYEEELNKDLIGQNPGILITKLIKDQSINLKANIRKGIGRMHSKWSPVGVSTYFPVSDTTYRYSIESIGSLSPDEIFMNALQILTEKLDKIVEDVG